MQNRNPKWKYKTITVPTPQLSWNQLVMAICVGVLGLGLLGYVIGDIRQPPAPAPAGQMSQEGVSTLEAAASAAIAQATAMALQTPTASPTAVPTQAPTQPVVESANPTSEPPEQVNAIWGVNVVIDTPVAEMPAAAAPAVLQPMTGEECEAAALAAGWSGTWGPASDGCWIISPDGSQVTHLGTWAE